MTPTSLIPLEQRERHPDLWFQDGTVVVATKPVIFKVYRGILIKHSVFFRRMFDLPQPTSAPTFEGVPVVEFFEEPEEVAHFLSALHDPSSYETDKWNDPSLVKALLRLSTKYEVEWLKRKLIAHIALRYPYTLINFSKRKEREHVMPSLGHEVVSLAQETNTTIIIPAALYEIAVTPPSSWTGLSYETLRLVSHGHEKLRQKVVEIIGSFLKNLPALSPTCEEESCSTCANQFFGSITWESWMKEPDILKLAADKGWIAELRAEGLCTQCEQWLRDKVSRIRYGIWFELPSYFDLPPWATLKEMAGIQGKDDDELEYERAVAAGEILTGEEAVEDALGDEEARHYAHVHVRQRAERREQAIARALEQQRAGRAQR